MLTAMKTTRILAIIVAGLCLLALPQCKKEKESQCKEGKNQTEAPTYPEIRKKDLYGKWLHDASLDKYEGITEAEWDGLAILHPIVQQFIMDDLTIQRNVEFVSKDTVRHFATNDFTTPSHSQVWRLDGSRIFLFGEPPTEAIITVENGILRWSSINRTIIVERLKLYIKEITDEVEDPKAPEDKKYEMQQALKEIQALLPTIEKRAYFAIWRGHRRQ